MLHFMRKLYILSLANKLGRPVDKMGIHEMSNVPTKIAISAGTTELAIFRMG